MNDRIKIYEDLDLLVKMTRAKGDGPALKYEVEEINNKIEEYNSEIEEIRVATETEIYDVNAEMADRNMKIIIRRSIQTIELEIRNKKNYLEELKMEEINHNKNIDNIKKNRKSHEEYLNSIKERVNDVKDTETEERYKKLIVETENKINILTTDLEEQINSYENIQSEMESIAEELRLLEEKLNQKEEQLKEIEKNLADKTSYVDQIKKAKREKRIEELEEKKQYLEKKLQEIEEEPKYLELKIKEIIASNKNNASAKKYLSLLGEKARKQPFMDVPVNNALEEELLKATQARDTFANEIDHKNYNLMESENPDQIRMTYLQERINSWSNDIITIQDKIALIDSDTAYNYQQRERIINEMIEQIKVDIKEYEKADKEEPASNISAKASLRVALEEKRQDLESAELYAAQFRKEEAEEINAANKMTRIEIDNLVKKIDQANSEMECIKKRLLTKKSGLIDISTKNKDKEKLKKLAEVVINIKHRRQFTEQPEEVIKRLENALNITEDKNKEEKVLKEVDEISTNQENEKPIEETK